MIKLYPGIVAELPETIKPIIRLRYQESLFWYHLLYLKIEYVITLA